LEGQKREENFVGQDKDSLKSEGGTEGGKKNNGEKATVTHHQQNDVQFSLSNSYFGKTPAPQFYC